MARPQSLRKAKKTFSLSRQAVKYLEGLRREKRAKSMSSILEDLILRQKETNEMERLSKEAASFYDSLTSAEKGEDRAWGDFAATQFPSKD